jgi:hypothetical protein
LACFVVAFWVSWPGFGMFLTSLVFEFFVLGKGYEGVVVGEYWIEEIAFLLQL